MYWWDHQLFSVKLRQESFCIMKTLHIIKFYGNSTKNETNHFHKKAKWVNSFWTQNMYMLLKWDSISWRKTLVILDNFVQWLVGNTLFPEMMNHHNQERMDSKKHENWTCIRSNDSFIWCKHGVEIRIWSLSQDNSHSWVRISYGTNKSVVDSNYNTQMFLQIYLKNKRHNRVWRLLQPDQRQNQNHKEKLLNYRALFQWMKESGLILNQQIHPLSLRTRSRRKWSIFFNTITQYSGKMMDQFSSPESSFIFGINFHKFLVGRMIVGNFAWQQEEDQKEDMSIVHDISGKILYFHALQGHSRRDLIDPLWQDNVIIQCGLFRHIHHIGCVFNLHSIIYNGLVPGGQDSCKRQTVFFLPIDPRNKKNQDPEHIDYLYHVEHDTCAVHGKTSRRCILGWNWLCD